MAERVDVVVVGAGPAGLMAAELAGAIGLRTVLVERDRLGGGGRWRGSIPSKALLASARVAHTVRTARRWGIDAAEPVIDTAAVWQRVRAVRAGIAQTDDDAERLATLGVEVRWGSARLVDPHRVAITHEDATTEVEAGTVVVCTGSRPVVPDIEGLADVVFWTPDSLFEADRPPDSMVVLGGGPAGVELAQALNRLGIDTTLLEQGPRLLRRDEPELVDVLSGVLQAEGVAVHTEVAIDAVRSGGAGGVIVTGTVAGDRYRWAAGGLLVCAGRRPCTEGLGLEELGIEVGPDGVATDARRRTAVGSVYAAGDVTGGDRFAHAAEAEAVQAVRDAFFPGRARTDRVVPWCTFTDPALAHSGLTVAEAEQRHGDSVEVWRADLAHSDRARVDGTTDGAVMVVTARGRIVGAHVLAPGAGEVIGELTLAIEQGLRLSDLAAVVQVHPTVTTALGRLGTEAVFERANRLRWLVRKAR